MGERALRQAQQHRRIVVPGDAVRPHQIAPMTPMNDGPLAVWTNPDGDRFHRATAGALTIARGSVDVTAPEALGAVIAMLGTEGA